MESSELSQRDRILETARVLIRRFGGAKTNVVDIAQAMGLSHSAIYRHFRSKADIFDALAAATMAEEALLAETYVKSGGPAAERLTGLVLALHRSKRLKFADDPEMHALYRRIVEERPDFIADYAQRMTGLVRRLLSDGVAQGEFAAHNLDQAAAALRDAVTVFVHPAHVEAAARAGVDQEPGLLFLMETLLRGLSRPVGPTEAGTRGSGDT